MSITFALVAAFPNRLRYLATNSGSPLGGTAAIPNDAGATPDLQTDTGTFNGPLFQIARARVNGIGTIAAATALNQAQSRAILMDDNTVSVGNANVPRARTTITPRSGTAGWDVDANVDGGGDPTVEVTSTAAAGTAYIDVEVAGAALSGG